MRRLNVISTRCNTEKAVLMKKIKGQDVKVKRYYNL